MSTDVNAAAENLLRSRRYIALLIIAAILGVPISAFAYGYLKLVNSVQGWVYTNLPHGLGFASQPAWWPLLPCLLAGVAVGVTVRYLPGRGGEVPLEGFKAGGVAPPLNLPGIAIASFAGISLGPVIGPEGPLIALGGGIAAAAIRLVKRDMPAQALAIIAATGSFAAVSTLLGSPIVGALLLMEAAGLTRTTASAVLVPGLLGAGVGALIFTGLDALTGFGTFSLAIPNPPPAGRPTGGELGWALAIGVLAAILCWLIRRAATPLRGLVERWTVPATVLIGLAVAGLAIGYVEATGHTNADVLFSGQNELPALIQQASTYSVNALLLIVVFKGLAYAGCLVAFRGGPTFPALFIGAAGGLAMSHLPGLGLVAGAAAGIGAMIVGMLRLPLASVLLTTLLFGSSGIQVMPLVIIAVVVTHVITIRLTPRPAENQSDPTRQAPRAQPPPSTA